MDRQELCEALRAANPSDLQHFAMLLPHHSEMSGARVEGGGFLCENEVSEAMDLAINDLSSEGVE